MSNLDECCRFGVLMPSGTSFGVVVSLSKAPDFCPLPGGARSPGIVSAAPGGGTCGAFPELGLMTTLGATPCPDLVGVPGAPEPA